MFLFFIYFVAASYQQNSNFSQAGNVTSYFFFYPSPFASRDGHVAQFGPMTHKQKSSEFFLWNILLSKF